MGNVDSLPVPELPDISSSSSSSPSVDLENLVIEKTPPVHPKPVICYATNKDFSQELSLFPHLIWKRILGYVSDSNTILALLNTSPYFHQTMKELDLLFQAALPHLMESSVLDFPTTLQCRLANPTMKSTVDKTFRVIRNANKSRGRASRFPIGPYSFFEISELDSFMNHFGAIPHLSQNPFVDDCVKLCVHSPEYYERAIEFLTKFGHLIKELELTFEQLHHPATLMNRLIRALTFVPNLEQLRFRFTGFPAIEMDIVDGNQKTTTDLTKLLAFPVPPASDFPRLPQFSEMEIMQRFANTEDLPPHEIDCMIDAIRVMLEAYGPQLSVLKCGEEMFLVDLQAEFFSQNLHNLSELSFVGFGYSNELDSMAKLSNIQLPKLARLSLEMEWVVIRNSFLGLLNNLRDSLEELYLWRRETIRPLQIQTFLLDDPPPPVMLLPKLKLLTVDPPDMNMDINGTFWTALQPRLRNLECLEFRISRWIFGYNENLPEVQVRNNFFTGFPNLNQFIWKVTRDGCVNSTVITRLDTGQAVSPASERIPYNHRWRNRI